MAAGSTETSGDGDPGDGDGDPGDGDGDPGDCFDEGCACDDSSTCSDGLLCLDGGVCEPDPFDKSGDFTRVDRVGMPAINSAVISPMNKNTYNAADPVDDANGDFQIDIVNNVSALHMALDDDLMALGLSECTPVNCISQVAPLVIPDTLKIDLSSPPGFPNGRGLADPVIDITLAVVLLDLQTEPVDLFVGVLNPSANDVAFQSGFPYLAAPN